MPQNEADIALIGLAVMGQNLILNMNDKGYVVCAFNRTVSKVEEFLKNEAKGTKVIGATSLDDMVSKLKRPRKIVLLVKAGFAVDEFVKKLIPLLSKGDIIIDGGNSQYLDTQKWCKELSGTGILYVGMGVSGGEDGARYGPSLMPGGHPAAWPHIKEIFQAICAKAKDEPCCDWVGEDGAGHFVKMVHNGIEYGDMQLICEAYHLMKDVIGIEQDEMAKVFDEWNKGELDSFLIEITRDILKYKDSDGKYLLPKIRDTAGQKGTGKWTGISALEYGVPVTLIGEAVFSRCLSALKDERLEASKVLPGSGHKFTGDKVAFLEDLRRALYASKLISYAQGFMLLREAAKVNKWNLNYGSIALMWRGGCIIRSAFLGNIKEFKDEDLDRCFRMYANLNLKAPMVNCIPSQMRTLIYEGDLRFKDSVKEIEVRAFLLTDMLLICKKISKGSTYQYKMIRPKFMVDKIVPFPKYNPRTTKDLLSLVYVVVDEVGSAYNAFALSEPSKESGGSLRLWEQKVREARLTYDLSVWYARNPSRDISEMEMDSSSDYAMSATGKVQSLQMATKRKNKNVITN